MGEQSVAQHARERGEPWALPGLLDSYDAERRPVGRAVTENTEVQTLLAELTLVPRYERPAGALRRLFDDLLRMDEVNRALAPQVSALGTVYRPVNPGADPLVGRRMPDIGIKAAGPAARVYDLLPAARFVHLDLVGAPDTATAVTEGWGPRVTAVTVTAHDDHPDLSGVNEILVRPDGHVAWATRTTDTAHRSAERRDALTARAGPPAQCGRQCLTVALQASVVRGGGSADSSHETSRGVS